MKLGIKLQIREPVLQNSKEPVLSSYVKTWTYQIWQRTRMRHESK